MPVTHQDILDFWFVESGPGTWYMKNDAFDAEIRQRFEDKVLELVRELNTDPHAWEASSEQSLALIICLDQFPRNMYRDTPAAFAWDSHARDVSRRMIEKKWDMKIEQARRAFIYLPFMHSEILADQNLCVELMDRHIDNPNNYDHAIAHRGLIERFGRFPHRNAILGRSSTPEEIQFLSEGGYAP